MGDPPPIAPDYAILVDFEATCDTTDDELTRLQQCDTHEIIEFVRNKRLLSLAQKEGMPRTRMSRVA